MPIHIASETPETLVATVRNELSELDLLAKGLDNFGLKNNVPANVIYNFNLALEELLTNVLRHGYAERGDDCEIRVSVAVAGGTMIARVEDDARAFDPLAAPQPDIAAAIEKHPCQGLGIHLVRSVADCVAYERRDQRNCLTISKAF